MASLLTELQRQRDDAAAQLADAKQRFADLQATLDQLDSVITDMTRSDDAAALYDSVHADTTGVSIRATPKQFNLVPAPAIVPTPID